MSTVDAIGAGAFSATSGAGVGQLSSDEFFRLIFTELTHQDPLEPNDTKALLEQISNIQSIQSDVDMMDRLGELVGQSELSAGAGLIGRMVSGLSESDYRVSGVVDSVSRSEEGVTLVLENGVRVPMSGVDRVLDSEDPEPEQEED